MQIARVRIFRDVGFTEGAFRVPSANNTTITETPVFTDNDLKVAAKDFFSKMKLRTSFESIQDCTYLEIKVDYTDATESSRIYYGWIDRVEPSSDNDGYHLTIVHWHVDLWRTWIATAVPRNGITIRRAADGDQPPQNYPHRFMKLNDTYDILGDTTATMSVLWVFINCVITMGSTGKGTVTYAVPCWKYAGDGTLYLKYSDSKNVTTPPLNQILRGNLDEMLGIDPDAIYGAWISPIPPATVSGGGVISSDPMTMSGWTVEQPNSDSSWGCFALAKPSATAYKKTTVNLITTHPTLTCKTDDVHTYGMLTGNGSIAGSFPWGLSIDRIEYRIVNSDTSMYIACRGYNATSGEAAVRAAAEGSEIAIPLPALSITSNAYSSYVYSGQMEYDRASMEISRQDALQRGLAGTANAAAQGAIAGGVMGGMAGGIGAIPGAVIGAVTGATGQLIDTGANYLISEKTNAKLLDATLTAAAKQTGNLLLPGSGWDWLYNDFAFKLFDMKIDDYSEQERQADIDLYGVHVFEPGLKTLAAVGTGVRQIVNLEVGGPIPNDAREYIAKRFSDGVILV